MITAVSNGNLVVGDFIITGGGDMSYVLSSYDYNDWYHNHLPSQNTSCNQIRCFLTNSCVIAKIYIVWLC